MKLSRKNYKLRMDGNEIKRFNMNNYEYDHSLRDLCRYIAEEIAAFAQTEKLEFSFEEVIAEYYQELFLAINKVKAFKLVTTNSEGSDYHFFNISRKSKLEEIKVEIEKFKKALQVALKEMQDQDFECEITFS